MKRYKVDQIRNVALIGHGGCGKTMLAEAMLYLSKSIDRFGKVDDGTATMDHDPEEIKRKISLNTSLAPCEYKDVKINLLDTPGFFDFAGEVKGAVRVADAALVVVCAVSGLEVGTEKAWTYADEQSLPRLVVVNKMDRENANFDNVLTSLRNRFGNCVIPAQIPIGSAETFSGVVDLVHKKAYKYENGKSVETQIPAELQPKIDEYCQQLIESVAETDDDLIAKYLDGQDLTEDEIRTGFHKGTLTGKIVPVICCSSLKQTGVNQLLDMITEALPSPAERPVIAGTLPNSETKEERPIDDGAPLSALIFKTMADPFVGKLTIFKVYSGVLKADSQVWNANRGVAERIGSLFVIKGKQQVPVEGIGAGDIGAVAKLQEAGTGETLCQKEKPIILPGINFPKPKFSLAAEPKSKADVDKIGTGLARLMEEDPTFKTVKDPVTHEQVVSGLGDMHLAVIMSKLQKKFGAEVVLKTPRLPYKETIRGHADVEGKHKKQSGGRGQYGHVKIKMDPLPPGGGIKFVDEIFGGSVPREYIPAVEKGLHEIVVEGVLAGYPVVDVKVTLYDGSYHDVDSSEMAFKIATHLAFKKGFMEAKPILLEPIMNIVVTVPEEFMGDIIGDLNKKRGRILGMEPMEGLQVVKAQAPLAELFQYAIDLRSMTQGRGDFTMEFDHYEEVPAHNAELIIAEHNKNKQEEKEK
ncbi:MAG TPA: elongation factor G [Bacillota bacterium]|nr:elongation factor G [Bacillota bacterium]